MTDASTNTDQKTPWHLWVVGILGLLWSSMGTVDYTMTQTQNEAYLSGFTPEQLAYIDAFPAWAIAFWATAVWSAAIGCILLLLKKRWAVPVLLVSFLSMVVTTIQNYVFSSAEGAPIDMFSVELSSAIFIVALGLYAYARSMSKSGVLL